MQIFQWMLKKSAQEPPKMVTSSTMKKCEEGEMKSKNIVVLVDSRGKRRHVKEVEKSKVRCENLILFRFIQRKDVSKPFFYHTLNLKGLGSFGRSRDSDKTKKSKEVIAGGNKVLPIAYSSSLSSSRSSSHDSDNKDKRKTSRKTSGSRMKELLKWSAAAKGLSLKKRAASMVAADGEYESPKISFRWEPTTTTTTPTTTISAVLRALKDDEVECEDTSNSTPNHALQVGDAGIGNWITTDSEFVVLEL